MSWASKRRAIYFGIFIIFVTVAVAVIFYLFFYNKPTCSDGIKNQNEEAVDCGGICPTVCGFKTMNQVVLWSRSFKVSDGIYNAVAFVENPNFDTEAFNVPYSFKLYDKNNILISERIGNMHILPRSTQPVFERTINTGKRVPARTIFEFISNPKWVRSIHKQPNLVIGNKELLQIDTTPRLSAVIKNNSIEKIKNIEITAIVFDKEENAIAVSQTFVDFLNKNTSDKIFFTWSEPFSSKPTRIEIIPLVK